MTTTAGPRRSGPLLSWIAIARPPLARRLRRLDRALPIAVKLALPLAAVIGVTAVAYLSLALPLIRTELESAYTGQARTVATTVQAEYALHGTDRAADVDQRCGPVRRLPRELAVLRHGMG